MNTGGREKGTHEAYRSRYKECIRMLNGLEKSLERHIPEKDRRWTLAEDPAAYFLSVDRFPLGWPIPEH